MEQNKELVFQVMVTFPGLLEKEIVDYNKFHGTDFEMIAVIDDEVPFCKIRDRNIKRLIFSDWGIA